MKGVYQFIHELKLQILSGISSNKVVITPGFPIFLALIVLLVMPFLVAQKYLDINRAMIAVYSLLVIGVLWKFIRYIREKPSSRLDEIS